MADARPDLLLVVGADISELRRQLDAISREFQLENKQLKISADTQQLDQAKQSINELNAATKRAQEETAKLRQQQEAMALSLKNDLKDLEQAYTRQRSLLREQAAEQRAAQEKLGGQMAADARKQGLLDAEINNTRLRLIRETAAANEAASLREIRNIESIKTQLLALEKIQIRIRENGYGQAGINLSAQASAQQAELRKALAAIGDSGGGGGGGLPPIDMSKLGAGTADVTRQFSLLRTEAVASQGALSSLFDKFGNYVRIAGLLTVTYAGLNAVFSGFRELQEVDKTLHLIAATMETGADRARVLRDSYNLMFEANQRLGISFSEGGKVVFELQKVLNNNAETIRGAFLPALALASLGEGNQKDIIRALVGAYELFGSSLEGAGSEAEKFLKISDALIGASVQSIGDINGFTSALQTVGPVAKASGVGMNETLALLALLQNGMQSATRAGTGLARLFRDIQENAPRIARAFNIQDFDVNKPVQVLEILRKVVENLRNAGPITFEVSQNIKNAFGDERAERALLTLVELFPQFDKVLRDVNDSAGKTKKVVEELGASVSAAFGRLGGTALDSLNKLLAALQGGEVNKNSGIVRLIDSVSEAIGKMGTAVEDLGKAVQRQNPVTLGLLGAIFGGAVGGVPGAILGASVGVNASQPQTDQQLADAAARQKAAEAELRRIINGPGGRSLYDVENPDLAAIESGVAGQAAAEAPYAKEFNYELKPVLRLPREYTAELAKDVVRIKQTVQAELDRTNPELPFNVRIQAAEKYAADLRQQVQQATKDYGEAVFGGASTAQSRDAALKSLQAALEKQGRAEAEIAKIRRDELVASIKEDQESEKAKLKSAKAAQDLNDELTRAEAGLAKLKLSNTIASSFDDATLSADKFAVKVGTISDSILAEVKPTTDKIYETLTKATDNPAFTPEQLAAKWTAGMKLIDQITAETFAKVRDSINRATLGDSARSLETFVAQYERALAANAGPALLNQIADKAVGLDKVTDSIRAQTEALGKYGPDAAVAGQLASHGFASMAALGEMILATGNPALIAFREALLRLIPALKQLELTQLQTDLDKTNKEILAVTLSFGKWGEEAIREQLAAKARGKSFEELAASTDEDTRKLAANIAAMAKATAASQELTAKLALQKAGYDEVTASIIVNTNAQDRATEDVLKKQIDELDKYNGRLERLKLLQDELAIQQARGAGDPFGFFAGALKKAGDEAGDFWANLRTLAQETAKSMNSALSDYFFDSFTGKLEAGKNAFKSFTDSMLRAISDLMAKQVVQALLALLSGDTSKVNPNGLPPIVPGGTGVLNLAGAGAGSGGAGAVSGLSGLLAGVTPSAISSNYSAAGGGGAGISAVIFGQPGQAAVPEAGYAGTPGTSGILGSGGEFSKALRSLGTAAAAFTAITSLQTYTNPQASQQQQNSALGGLLGTAVGGLAGYFLGPAGGAQVGAGAGGILGQFLGGLFGSSSAPPSATSEYNRTLGSVQTTLEAQVNQSKTFNQLFAALLASAAGRAGGNAVSLAIGGQSISNFDAAGFFTALRQNPSSLTASVQAGLSPDQLAPLNAEVTQAILAKVSALDDVNTKLNQALTSILTESLSASAVTAVGDNLKAGAAQFRTAMDQIIAANQAQQAALYQQLQTATDPQTILDTTTQIKALIESRYNDEINLVKQFGGALDQLATNLRNVSKSITDQIFQLQLSNFGPTNPLQGFQTAQARFEEAKTAFAQNPTPENAQAIQALVDPLLKSASEVFTRPSPEYRAIYDEVIATLEQVKSSVDQQADDITTTLTIALGKGNSIADLTQKNTALMALDLHQLLDIAKAQIAMTGAQSGAGSGSIAGIFQPPTQQQPQQAPAGSTSGSGTSTAAAATIAVATAVLPSLLKLIPDSFFKGITDSIANLFSAAQTSVPYYGDIANVPNYGISPDSGYVYDPSYSPYVSDYSSYAYADGGRVPGSGTGDIVRAMLEPGEFVVRKDAAMRYRSWLEQINGPGNPQNQRGVLRFADGGTVPGTSSTITSQDVATILYLQAAQGGSTAQNQALINALILKLQQQKMVEQQATATGTTGTTTVPAPPPTSAPPTPSATGGGTPSSSAPPPAIESTDSTLQVLQILSGVLSAGGSLTSLLLGNLGLDAATSGTISGSISALTGGLTLVQGVESGDIFQTLKGGVGLVGGALSALSSLGVIPSLAEVVSGIAAQLGIEVAASSVPGAGAVVAAIIAALNIAEIASNDKLSDEDKAILATETAVKAAAAIAAPFTFGASLAVMQIIDFAERLRAGQDFDQAIVSANDPTAIFGGRSGISGQIFYPSDDWLMFGTHLAETFQKGGIDLQRMVGMLNYVQSKEELAGVLNSYRTWVQSDNGWPWYGSENPDPYTIPAFPEAGGSAHEGGLTMSFEDPISKIQSLVNALLGILPGNKITDLGYYNTGEAGRLQGAVWAQAHPPTGLFSETIVTGFSGEMSTFGTQAAGLVAPIWTPNGDGTYTATQYSSTDLLNAISAGTVNGTPIYDPRSGAWGYTYQGTTAASLGIPDANALLAPYYRNFGATNIPIVPAVSVNYVDMVRPAYGSQDYWAQHPDELQAAIEQQALFNVSPGGMAAGGWVSGGSPGFDSVPKLLEPGEFVVPSDIARAHANELAAFMRSSDGPWMPNGFRTAGSTPTFGRPGSEGFSVALNIAPGAIAVSGADDPKAVGRAVLEEVENSIRTGRLGQVVSQRVRGQKVG